MLSGSAAEAPVLPEPVSGAWGHIVSLPSAHGT